MEPGASGGLLRAGALVVSLRKGIGPGEGSTAFPAQAGSCSPQPLGTNTRVTRRSKIMFPQSPTRGPHPKFQRPSELGGTLTCT